MILVPNIIWSLLFVLLFQLLLFYCAIIHFVIYVAEEWKRLDLVLKWDLCKPNFTLVLAIIWDGALQCVHEQGHAGKEHEFQ